MLEYLTLGQFVVAVLMGLAALCAFVWGVASGAFRDVENVKDSVLRAEGVERDAGERSR
jgi:cbb3-type cytochrome oxidase maturation protein